MKTITEEQVQVVKLLVDPSDPLGWERDVAVDRLCILDWDRAAAQTVVDRAITAFSGRDLDH